MTFVEKLLPHDRTGLETICTSLWAAQDARLLPAPTNFAPSAFYNLVGTILDCIVLLNIRSAQGAGGDAEVPTSDDMGHAVALQVGRVWNEGVIPEASKIVRMTRMIGAEKNTDFYKMASNVGSTIARLEKVDSSESHRNISLQVTELISIALSPTSGTANEALDEIARLTTSAFSPSQVGDGAGSSSSRTNLIPRLQMLLEAVEQGYTGEGPRIKAFTDGIALQVASRAVHYIGQCLSVDDSADKLAQDAFPKMLAHLIEKRGVYLLQDDIFDRVSPHRMRQIAILMLYSCRTCKTYSSNEQTRC